MKLTIGHLYPDLLNLYGDRGNIQCLMKRCQWRGIEAETIALDLVDLYTEQGEGRLISNIVLKSDLFEMPVVGFENHGGRTCINNCKPLGKVLYGSGNDGKTGYEGVVYKNVIGTYLHGPLLPKNPQLADWLISHALEKKYGKAVQLEPLDDTEEKAANEYVYHRFVKES